ncbi:CARDB domain-containing protein [Thermococcus sp. EP1]|uniref:CARDB domain-containing protein n=1 Tax=Thermococcus sp. EP1 TaxID=1591054 RepID=UPI0006DCFB20|nr:CARDB domain-containing protein [Thermococcus sp. EP1]
MRRSVPLAIVILVLFNVVPAVKFVSAQGAENLWVINSQELIWKDAAGDQRTEWGANTHVDITEFRVTTDQDYLYFLVKLNNTNSWHIGDNGAPFLAITIDTDQVSGSGQVWFSGESDTQLNPNAAWERQIVINLADSRYSGQGLTYIVHPLNESTNNWGAIFQFLDTTWSHLYQLGDTGTYGALAVNLSNGIIEVKISWNAVGGIPSTNKIRIEAITGRAWSNYGGNGGGTWDIGGVSDALDAITNIGPNTWDEVDDGIVNYYLEIELADISGHPPVIIDADASDWLGEFILPKPELTVSISSNVLNVEEWQPGNITITVKNIGDIDANDVLVVLYDGNTKLDNWTIGLLPGGGEISLNYEYLFDINKVGIHTLKVVVDPSNTIEEVNEANNVAKLTLKVGASVMLQNQLVTAGYTLEPMYEDEHQKTLSMLEELSSLVIPPKYKDKIPEFEAKMNKSRELFETGQKLLRYRYPYYSYIGALRIYGSYSLLKRVQKDIDRLKILIESGLSKEIDGSLADWNESTKVAEDIVGLGQEGANLKALYVDYDDNYLYIALVGDNKASWDIAYGIGIDVNGEESGYSDGLDMWVRRMGFDPPIDFEYYLQWTSGGGAGAQKFGKWIETNSTWDERPISDWGIWSGITGSSEGLKVLELAIPWDALGGKPSVVRVVAFVTGGYPEDSAVEALPDNPSMHELTDDVKGYGEWTDFDLITVFAEIEVS